MVVICGRGTAVAQEQTEKETQTVVPPNASATPASRAPRVVPLKIQVVLSKYQGEKKVSTMPYMLSLATGQPGQPANGRRDPHRDVRRNANAAVISFNYRSVGTSIDCSAEALDGGRYSLNIGLEDSSVYSEDQEVRGLSKAGSDQPSFNTFKANETVILKDGESSQFTSCHRQDQRSGHQGRCDVDRAEVGGHGDSAWAHGDARMHPLRLCAYELLRLYVSSSSTFQYR